MSEAEELLLRGLAAARQWGHGTFGGTKEQTMAQVYEMFVRHGILSNTATLVLSKISCLGTL